MATLSQQPVYVIIPVHNRKRITLACLNQLANSGDLQRFHIVVVDDGSTDGTSQAIRALYPEVIILSGDGTLWWTGAIVDGMQYAYEQGAEFCIWLNDDCQISDNTLTQLVSFCREHPDAIVGCQGLEATDSSLAFGGKRKTWRGYRFIQVPSGQISACDLLSGNLVCLPRRVMEAVGYPDPVLTPHYGGDSLFLIRAKKAGFQLFVDARTLVLNLAGESALYPKCWLLGEGDPLMLLRLVFVPQSGLSWRIWLRLNWEAYSVWGIAMFMKKYSSIGLITLLRCLPLSFRKKLFAITQP